MYIAIQNLYLTDDRKEVVYEDDARQAFVLAGEGCPVDAETVRKYDLLQRKDVREDRSGRAAKPAKEEWPTMRDAMSASVEKLPTAKLRLICDALQIGYKPTNAELRAAILAERERRRTKPPKTIASANAK
jgi:hypothetical protein